MGELKALSHVGVGIYGSTDGTLTKRTATGKCAVSDNSPKTASSCWCTLGRYIQYQSKRAWCAVVITSFLVPQLVVYALPSLFATGRTNYLVHFFIHL